jgi:hypothetical protein
MRRRKKRIGGERNERRKGGKIWEEGKELGE